MKKYWIKTNLFKDGTPQWDAAIGEENLIKKIKELEDFGYKVTITDSMTEDV